MAEEIDPQDLSHLNPLTVLGNAAAIPPVQAVTEPQNIVQPTREELLRQAAEAPDTELILPPPPLPLPVISTVQLTSESFPLPLPIAVVLSEPKPLPPAPKLLPPAPKPTSKSALPAVTQGPDIETMHAHRLTSKRKPLGPIVAAIGAGMLLLFIVAAILYVLVLRGIKIPLLYPAVSHLSVSGMQQRDHTSLAVRGTKSYQYVPNSQISLHLKAGTTKSLGSNAATPPATVTTTFQVAQAVVPSEQILAKVNVLGSGTIQVPLSYATSDTNWQVNLPLNTTVADQTVSTPALRSSFLAIVIQPPALQQILKAATSVAAYHQETQNGQRTAIYTYAVDVNQLSTVLGGGVTVSDPSLSVAYAWGSDLPRSAQLTATLKQGAVEYAYVAALGYWKWDQLLQDNDLTKLSTSTGAKLSVGDLIAQLGFAAGSLPGSGATAVHVSLPALVPAGEYTTQLLPTITATPPLPTTASTAQIIADDTQRKADLQLLQLALERYKNDHSDYPKSQGLEQVQASSALLAALVPSYSTALPIDPSQTIYWYEYRSDGVSFSLRSVAQNASDNQAKLGTAYHYFELNNPKP